MLTLAAISVVSLLIALLLAGVVYWALAYFGVPVPLAAIAAVVIFLLCVAGGVSID